MSRLHTDRTNKTKLDDESTVLEITTNITNTDEAEQGQETWENYKKTTEQELNWH